MLYQKSKEDFDIDLFINPTNEYRATPFWAWNTTLNRDCMEKQIEEFKSMGMGGFHMHSRIGLNTPYLSDEFMEMAKFCNQKAKSLGMLTWLYDEDKWPSGYGGGFVTKETQYRSRYLLFSPIFHENGQFSRNIPQENRLGIDGELSLLAKYEVNLVDGYLNSYRMLSENETCSIESMWYAYIVISKDMPWFNNQAYVDTLNPKAIQRFIEVTYERYSEVLGREFSKSVPAIFTDEPQFVLKQNFRNASIKQEVGIPYTNDFDKSYFHTYGCSFLEHLPEVFWELGDRSVSQSRYRYHEHIAERFVCAYADTIGEWCEKHSIMLTGHMMAEATLESQTRSLGEAMRAYRSFQLPGIDILSNEYEYSTAKQAQSASRQYGCPGVTSELYGVTNWDFDFRGYKLQGDWQAALGVTVRVPHLSWVGMKGESKRDYPAPIDSHSPWYSKYSLIEDYFSRLNTVMTRGTADVRIGVIHPIESYWLLWGPDNQTKQERIHLQENFDNIIQWLLFQLLDFDFIAESLLPEQYSGIEENKIKIGVMQYDKIIVPELTTIRSSTIRILEEFQKKGGDVIYMGKKPSYIDGNSNLSKDECLKINHHIGYSKWELLDALEAVRQVDIVENSARVENLLYQMREEESCKWLFIAQGKPVKSMKLPEEKHCEISVKGYYDVIHYDTMKGTRSIILTAINDGKTVFHYHIFDHDSILFQLIKRDKCDKKEGQTNIQNIALKKENQNIYYLNQAFSYELTEPNVLLLDIAKYKLDNGEWQEREELLRIDNLLRQTLNYPLRTDSFPQPWLTVNEECIEHMLTCSFDILSEIQVDEIELAYEGEGVQLFWNNKEIKTKSTTFFVDECFHVVKIGKIIQGKNELVLKIPYGKKTEVEWCYLLGDFGTRVRGDQAAIVPRQEKLYFSDLSRQGFTFYGGNISCYLSKKLPAGYMTIEIPQYQGALVEIIVDDQLAGHIITAPYRLECGQIEAGEHKIEIKWYGNRYAMFGQLHNSNKYENRFDPLSWRTRGNAWCYEYQIKPTGILTAPILTINT